MTKPAPKNTTKNTTKLRDDLIKDIPMSEEDLELERKIKEAELSLNKSRIVLNIDNETFNRLQQASVFHRCESVESYCEKKLKETLNVAVGKPSINAPSNLSGVKTGKVTGPSRAFYERSNGN